MSKEIEDLKRQINELKAKHDGVCEHCGHCKHCGRGGQVAYPLYPIYPYYPQQPYWWGQVWLGGGTSVQTSGNISITGNTTSLDSGQFSYTAQ